MNSIYTTKYLSEDENITLDLRDVSLVTKIDHEYSEYPQHSFCIVLKTTKNFTLIGSDNYEEVSKCREALVFEWKAVVGRSS